MPITGCPVLYLIKIIIYDSRKIPQTNTCSLSSRKKKPKEYKKKKESMNRIDSRDRALLNLK